MNDPVDTAAAASGPEHAREMQARLYREMGVAAVAAALLGDGEASAEPGASTLDSSAGRSHVGRAMAA